MLTHMATITIMGRLGTATGTPILMGTIILTIMSSQGTHIRMRITAKNLMINRTIPDTCTVTRTVMSIRVTMHTMPLTRMARTTFHTGSW